MRLTDRGVLKEGMWADVVIFDPATVRDLATFDDPNQLSQGMDYVLVNGVPVIDQGKMTGACRAKCCAVRDTCLKREAHFASGFNRACSVPGSGVTRGSARVPVMLYPGAAAPGNRVSLKSSCRCKDAVPLNSNLPLADSSKAFFVSIFPSRIRACPERRVIFSGASSSAREMPGSVSAC